MPPLIFFFCCDAVAESASFEMFNGGASRFYTWLFVVIIEARSQATARRMRLKARICITSAISSVTPLPPRACGWASLVFLELLALRSDKAF